MIARQRQSILCIVLALFAPCHAFAAVTSSFAGGVLDVASDAADGLTVGCTGVGGNVTVNGANPGTGAVACALVTQLAVTGGPGANAIDIAAINSGNYPALTSRSVDSGAGADTIEGSAGADVLIAGSQADTVSGNQGSDIVFLGDGDDTFVWDPGDVSDTLEGQAGFDTLRFNGSNTNENFDFSANGARLLFSRDVAAVIIDANDIERVEQNVVGGADDIVVNSLAGTDVAQIRIDLAGTLGGPTGDAQIDNVTFNGTAGGDSLSADAAAGTVTVTNGITTVTLTKIEPDTDNLTLNGADGNDTITVGTGLAGQVATLAADGGIGTDTVTARGTTGADTITANAVSPFVSSGAIALIDVLAAENVRLEGLANTDTLGAAGNVAALFTLTLDGGAGTDTLNGGNGADVLLGGGEIDQLDGNQGTDIVFGGDGNDVLQWDPGDGNDTLEGQGGVDTLRFNGSNANENIDLSANGGRLRLFRDIGAIILDTDDIEQIDYNAVGGTDNAVINDLTGTDATIARVLLAATLGGAAGDAQIDNVTVNAAAAADTMSVVTAPGNTVAVVRGAFTVHVRNAELANDRVIVNSLGGNDMLNVLGIAATLAKLTLDAGAGTGDVVAFTGEAGAENYIIAPDAADVALSRSAPSAFDIDIANTEWLQLDAAAGADTVNTQGLPTTSQILDGGSPTVLPADTLNVAGFTGDVLASPIVLPGFAPIVHANFEQTDNPLVIESFLNGAQETPRNPSTGRGYGTVTLNGAQDSILVFLEYSGLAGNNTLVHIHGPAPRGVAAPPIIDLPASGATSGMFTVGPFAVTPAQVADLRAGRWYFNVHSTAPGSSGGEIRGQIDDILFRDGFD